MCTKVPLSLATTISNIMSISRAQLLDVKDYWQTNINVIKTEEF
jgi:hypothetical protein